jgi:hypothetical protein
VVTHPVTIDTLAATSHGLDVETISRREVVAQRCTAFHLCMYRLRRDAVAVAATLIGYDVGLLPG